MDIIGQVKQYAQYVRQNPYIYELQKQGIELLINFLKSNPNHMVGDTLDTKAVDYFLSYWVPRSRKYLSEVEAYNIVYTLHDICHYLNRKDNEADNTPIILDMYGQEYIRLYKSRKLLAQLAGDPVIATNPIVISLDTYKEYKQKKNKKDSMSMYEQGMFRVDEINKDGYISFNKVGSNRYFKVLFRPSVLANFKAGDILHITLKRRIFFIYWEIDEIRGYYLSNAISYI